MTKDDADRGEQEAVAPFVRGPHADIVIVHGELVSEAFRARIEAAFKGMNVALVHVKDAFADAAVTMRENNALALELLRAYEPRDRLRSITIDDIMKPLGLPKLAELQGFDPDTITSMCFSPIVIDSMSHFERFRYLEGTLARPVDPTFRSRLLRLAIIATFARGASWR